jgi:hypothetical protein
MGDEEDALSMDEPHDHLKYWQPYLDAATPFLSEEHFKKRAFFGLVLPGDDDTTYCQWMCDA